MQSYPFLEIYTDGAASGNPGPGGFGVVLKYGNHRKEISAGFRYTTNNRMELLAVIVALEALKGTGNKGKLYSDSTYVVESINKGRLRKWIGIGFKKIKNSDLWIRLHSLLQKQNIVFVWVKGHASNVENNRCDQLAVAASKMTNLPADVWFEQHQSDQGLFE